MNNQLKPFQVYYTPYTGAENEEFLREVEIMAFSEKDAVDRVSNVPGLELVLVDSVEELIQEAA